jgi:hypothetical protein
MQLSNFLYDLLFEGSVTVEGQLVSFTQDDLQQCEKILQEFYTEDVLHMPLTAPAWSPLAAVWAARYFYTAVQLTVLRELDDDAVDKKLPRYAGKIDAPAMYSADLVLRQLPHLHRLVKGLAPGDILVKKLQETAARWPFSSVGMELETGVDETVIFNNPSLQTAYIDRVMAYKDKRRLNSTVMEHVKAASGNFSVILWPELEDYTLNHDEWKLTTTDPQ